MEHKVQIPVHIWGPVDTIEVEGIFNGDTTMCGFAKVINGRQCLPHTKDPLNLSLCILVSVIHLWVPEDDKWDLLQYVRCLCGVHSWYYWYLWLWKIRQKIMLEVLKQLCSVLKSSPVQSLKTQEFTQLQSNCWGLVAYSCIHSCDWFATRFSYDRS